MREAYREFEVVKDTLINQVYIELRNGTYTPSEACKFFTPKPSGGLRTYTLLTIKDQLVFQALINIVAEKLYPQIKSRYYKKVFGNLYSGNSNSIWFYKKWSDGYHGFNNAARKAFKEGKVYMASFDLVACYDSIDHNVLKYYLGKAGVNKDIIETLCKYLSVWTSTDHNERIYQGHGIPQGPLSSGLLSEVVLRAFDDEERSIGVEYIRYVDDIWFFATDEDSLRSELVKMDRVSKKIGLFPQSSKISIRQIMDIEKELKTISTVYDSPILVTRNADYFSELVKITPKYKIEDISKFRFCAARAKPDAKLINRLWKIFYRRPDMYPQLCAAIHRNGKISKISKINIKRELKKGNPYISIHASFVNLLNQIELTPEDIPYFIKLVKLKFHVGIVLRNKDAGLSAAVFGLLCKHNGLTKKQLEIVSKSPFWYTRRHIARSLPSEQSQQIKNFLRDESTDVQITAASMIVRKDIQVPSTKLKLLPNTYFQQYGLRTGGNQCECYIDQTLSRMLNIGIGNTKVHWKKLLGYKYKQALEIIVTCNSSSTTNAGAWINELDSFNEIVVRSIFENDVTLGTMSDNYGGVFGAKSRTNFLSNHRVLHSACDYIHKRRVTNVTSHPFDRKTGIPTTPFKFKEMKRYLEYQMNIIDEIAVLFPL